MCENGIFNLGNVTYKKMRLDYIIQQGDNIIEDFMSAKIEEYILGLQKFREAS